MNAKVDEFISKHDHFSTLLNAIRKVILKAGLEETIKWGMPTYVLNNKNVVGIGAFKAHCGIWFFQGALLKDEQHVLMNAQEGKTKAMRQWRFTAESKLDQALLHAYLIEAIENENKGLRIKIEPKPLVIPTLLHNLFVKDAKLAAAFERLTLSKKKEFAAYISTAKREETKYKRLEASIPMILNNVGLNDIYKKNAKP